MIQPEPQLELHPRLRGRKMMDTCLMDEQNMAMPRDACLRMDDAEADFGGMEEMRKVKRAVPQKKNKSKCMGKRMGKAPPPPSAA